MEISIRKATDKDIPFILDEIGRQPVDKKSIYEQNQRFFEDLKNILVVETDSKIIESASIS